MVWELFSFDFSIRFLGDEASKADLPVRVENIERPPSIEFFKQKSGHKEKETLCILSLCILSPLKIQQVFCLSVFIYSDYQSHATFRTQ